MSRRFKTRPKADLFGEQTVHAGGTEEFGRRVRVMVEAGHPTDYFASGAAELKLVRRLVTNWPSADVLLGVEDTGSAATSQGPRVLSLRHQRRMRDILQEIRTVALS